MWLINVENHRLEQKLGDVALRYAILSHRWGDEEVSFQDMLDMSKTEQMQGFRKIKKLCELARAEKLKYAWIDTCCINKESSAEVSEAINSMYRYYRQSAKCYVFPGRRSSCAWHR